MNTSRRELLELLGALSNEVPELRLGQMFVNLSTLAIGAKPESVREVEDDELVGAAQRLLERHRSRNTTPT